MTDQSPQSEPLDFTEKVEIKRQTIAISIGILIGLIFIGCLWIWKRNSTAEVMKSIEQMDQSLIADILQPSATPYPFQEMTIPYLRERQYASQLGELEKIGETATYTSYLTSYDSDGLNINGLLTIPKENGPADNASHNQAGKPAIVFVHGYIPPTLYRTREKYQDYIDYLARNGYVVFKIDLRGHDQSEGEPGGSYYASDYIVDTLNARAALQASDFVQPEKVGLWGHSMAGNVVMRSLAAQPNIPAVAIWAGAVYTYTDQQKYGIQDNSYRPPSSSAPSRRRRQELFDQYGQFSPDNSFWKLVPATNYLTDIQGAVGLFHAINDDVVNIGYSRDLKPLLDASNVPNELHEYTSGGHNISGPAFSQAMQDTVAFYDTYLK